MEKLLQNLNLPSVIKNLLKIQNLLPSTLPQLRPKKLQNHLEEISLIKTHQGFPFPYKK
jgi:hypothetical protein